MTIILGVSFFVSSAYANLLGNAGFEQTIGGGTESNWNNTNGADRVTTTDGTIAGTFTTPFPEGTHAIQLFNGEYTFQTNDHVNPGNFVTFTAKAETTIAAVGGNGGQMKIEFKKVSADGSDHLISNVTSSLITLANATNGGGYITFSISGVAPPETGRVVFVLSREGGGAAASVVFDDANGEINPAGLAVSAGKSHVKAGEMVPVFLQFTNDSGGSLSNVEVFADIPHGLDFLPSSVRKNGQPVAYRQGSLIIPVGTMTAGQSVNAAFLILVTKGVTPGHSYSIPITIRNSSTLSDTGYVQLMIEEDPLFDQGTIIGKVFNDTNQNGIQNSGEKGIPAVRLVTEEGVIVITDADGKYYIPAVKTGRHVVKIDGHSLPEGTKFITEEAYLVKTTSGILNKANFAVLIPPSTIPEEFQKDLVVSISQGLDTSRPTLDVVMDPELLKVGLGALEKEPVFKFKINYNEFIKNWMLEVRDELGHEIWTGFGVSAPPAEVVWSGQANNGLPVKPGIYSYQFKVEDKQGHQDWTPLHFFRVISKADSIDGKEKALDIPTVGDFNIFKDGKQSIPLVAKPTIRIQGKTQPGNQVTINSQPVAVNSERGDFETEIYTTPGDKEIVVVATSPQGENTSYRKTVKVKDSTFFMVALGEEQLGVNFNSGHIEAAGKEGAYKDGFYDDGRLSYYLRGKLKGKFLVKSKYDTGDTQSALFTNLDPDNYYPIYGDNSKRDYEAEGTRQRFYFVIEMDKSFIKWGSFETSFTDNQIATYNRTLSGAKVHYETVSSTPYGDPKRGFDAFMAKSDHRADHNEFQATGGSLYYLRNRRVIQGSEKIRVEIHDKIQDISVASYDLAEGKDYEIDYEEGRILLSHPLSSVSASDTLVSLDILDGNPVFLIADYEYDVGANAFANANSGLRGYTHMGDHIRVGATAVDEDRQGNDDYQLRGVDATMKLGRNTKLTADYAESKKEQATQALSYNGGLSFADVDLVRGQKTRPRENAYLIKGESKPFKNFEVSGYTQGINPSFSTANIKSQEGTQKYGITTRYRIYEFFSVRYRFDHNKISDQLIPLAQSTTTTADDLTSPYEAFVTHTVQAGYDDGKRLAELEYREQNVNLPDFNDLVETPLSEMSFKHGVSGKVGYHVNDRLLPYIKVQTALTGKANQQFGGGFRYEIAKNISAYLEQMVGNFGQSTLFGFEKQDEHGTRNYTNLRMFDGGAGPKSLATTIGSSFALSEKSRVFSEREYSTYHGTDGYADILGYDGKAGDHWNFEGKFEKRYLDPQRSALFDPWSNLSVARNNSSNAISGGVGYTDGDKLRVRTRLELRMDQDIPKLRQWVNRNSLKYQINQDLSFLGKLDYGKSIFLEPHKVPANFAEFSTGFAYRPVDHDRLNILTRYTYLLNIANDVQFSFVDFPGIETDEADHIFSIDLAYDLYRYLTTVEKVAYKHSVLHTAVTDPVMLNTILLAHRFNFHVTRKWDVATEYRVLWQAGAAFSIRHGALLEVDRELYDYVRLGMGYNFTDFDDDLRNSSYKSHGPFVRMSGKF